MDLLALLAQIPKLMEEYKQAAAELEEAKRRIEEAKDDKYVDIDWVCAYFDVSKPTALLMLADVKVFVHGQKLKRFKRSDILRFARQHNIKVSDVEPLAHQPHKKSHPKKQQSPQ